jgi:hypothetical protein
MSPMNTATFDALNLTNSDLAARVARLVEVMRTETTALTPFSVSLTPALLPSDGRGSKIRPNAERNDSGPLIREQPPRE